MRLRQALRVVAGAIAALSVLAACANSGPTPSVSHAALDVLFVGGRYNGNETRMTGQAHVLRLTPTNPKHDTPLVFIPGQAQTITNFLTTPDGREGWAQYFAAQGYVVYLMDQPGRGASGYDEAYGPANRQAPSLIENRFTAVARATPAPGAPWAWPQARLHTQWPGAGVRGDAAFDQFFASQVEYASGEVSAELVADAGAALLDIIGPAIIVTHSQAGPFGWLIGERRPDLVRAIVAIEPSGPPFASAPRPWGDGDPERVTRAYGLTNQALAYEPALSDPAALTRQWYASTSSDLTGCWLQAEPARRLVNLLRVPVLVLAAEASYHAGYDHCTARYLQQAGVQAEFVRLPEWGARGNGHMVMLERNNIAIAAGIARWLESARRPDGAPVVQTTLQQGSSP